ACVGASRFCLTNDFRSRSLPWWQSPAKRLLHWPGATLSFTLARELLRLLGPIHSWRCAGSISAEPTCKPSNNCPPSLSFHRPNFDPRPPVSAAAPRVSEHSGDKAFQVICRL